MKNTLKFVAVLMTCMALPVMAGWNPKVMKINVLADDAVASVGYDEPISGIRLRNTGDEPASGDFSVSFVQEETEIFLQDPFTVNVPSNSFYDWQVPTGLPMGEYNCTAIWAVEGLEAPLASDFKVTVLEVGIEVRAKTSDDSLAYGSTASICAGGFNSNAHIAEIRVTTNPATEGIEISTSMSSSAYQLLGPSLSIGGTTGADGTISGTLTSGDFVESLTLTSTLDTSSASASVSCDWNIDWSDSSWVSDPEYIAETSAETVTLTHHGEPVNNHNVKFVVEELTYVNADFETLTTVDPTEIATYASFNPQTVVSDSQGVASSTLTTSTSADVLEEILVIHDLSVYETSINPTDGSPTTTNPTKTTGASAQIEFRNNGDISVASTQATATTPGANTSPPNGAKVTAGQNVTLQLVLNDIDQFKAPTDTVWKNFGAPTQFQGNYVITLTLTNAKFTADQTTTKTVNAIRFGPGVFGLLNQYITVNADWDGKASVGVKIEVKDQIKVPANFLPSGPVADTQLQDSDWTTTLSWTKATVFPTSATPISQTPGNVGEEKTTDSLTLIYLFGPDANGAGNNAANYENVAYNETFQARTSNLTKAWIHPDLIAQAPNATDAQWVATLFAGTGSANVTFTIGSTDHGSDTHTGRIFHGLDLSKTLSTDGLKATIYVDLPQKFEVPAGTAIADWIIRRKRTGKADGTGTYQMKKWDPTP